MILPFNYIRKCAILMFLWCSVFVHALIIDGYASVPVRSNDICSPSSIGRRIYLELGDKGYLKANNVSTVTSYSNQTDSNGNSNITNQNQFQCNLELVTCSSCVIKVVISFMNFTTQCGPSNVNTNTGTECRCEYLWLSEPPYDANVFGKRFCGKKQNLYYVSKTRSLSIKYVYRANATKNAFKLDYVTLRNKEEIMGYPISGTPINRRKHYNQYNKSLASPFFPALYPRDLIKEYLIVCNKSKGNNNINATSSSNNVTNNPCRIRLIFTDFQLALASSMEFYDWNGQQIDVYSGAVFRPPVIISSGPSMLIRFYANGGIALGYRADISFFTDSQILNSPIARPFTDCGGYVESLGGAITMMNMVSNDTEPRVYDCIWLIRPSNNYFHLKSHLSLRVDAFNNFAGKSELIIRQGLTSNHPDLDTIQWNDSTSSSNLILNNYVVPMTAGFYVSFNGVFDWESRLALVYTAFSYMDCYVGSEFLCENRKCIPLQLQCDGFDHCGDKSDEPDSCKMEWEREPFDRRWYSHTPNYYFPKMDRYPDLKTATAIFFISSLGLIFLISALIILLYKMGNRARQQRELQNHLQTISELLVITSLDNTTNNNSRQEEPSTPEEPPAYEAPPEYEEVIKVGMDAEMNRGRSNRRRSRSTHSRSCPRSQGYQNAILEVVLPIETPTSSMLLLDSASPCITPSPSPNLLPFHHVREEFSAYLDGLSEDILATQHIETTAQDSINTAFNTNKSSQTNSVTIPDTPPPIYRESSNSSIKIVIDSNSDIEDASIKTPSNSTSYFSGFGEDLIDVSFSLTTPENSSNNLQLFGAKENHFWEDGTVLDRNWLTFPSDEPTMASPEISTVASPADGAASSYGSFSSNLKSEFNKFDELNILDSTDPSKLVPSISTEQRPYYEIQCNAIVTQKASASKNLSLLLDGKKVSTCVDCGGQKNMSKVIENVNNKRGSVVVHWCQCNSPALINLNDELRNSIKSSTLLRRSSSVENFPFILCKRENVHKSL